MESSGTGLSFLLHMFQGGGIWMYPILAAQIFSIAIIAERVVALFVNRKLDSELIAKGFEDDIKRGQIDRVLAKAQSISGRPAIAVATAAGAQAALNFGGREEIQAKMDQVLSKEQGRVESKIEFLAMLGNVATLMGLLGTIVGMIRSFASIAQADEMARAAMLSAGIAEAMNATAFGLITAIPALVMYAVLTNRANKINEDLLHGATRVYNGLGFSHETVPNRSTRKTSVTVNN